MRTTLHMTEVEGAPMAMRGPDGEWVEVGYVTALDFTVEQAEFTSLDFPMRIDRRYTMSVDIEANSSASHILLNIARRAGRAEA